MPLWGMPLRSWVVWDAASTPPVALVFLLLLLLEMTTATTTITTAAASTPPSMKMRFLRWAFCFSAASRSSRSLRACSRCSFLEANRPVPSRRSPGGLRLGTSCQGWLKGPRRGAAPPLEARRVAGREARVGAPVRRLPAGAALGAARVEAQPGYDHEGVAGVGVDRDPAARPRLAVAHEAARGERAVEQPGARQRERDGARAVVARVLPGAVPAAPLVGLGGDLVAGGDHRGHDVGRLERGHGGSVRARLRDRPA